MHETPTSHREIMLSIDEKKQNLTKTLKYIKPLLLSKKREIANKIICNDKTCISPVEIAEKTD